MALQTNLFTTYSGIGNREDLMDFIFNVDPTDVPFVTAAQRANATATLHEWQTDVLAAAAANAQLEGETPTVTAAVATVRLSNTCQISTKIPGVTGTQEAVRHAGRQSEMTYQTDKLLRELRRDIEFNLRAMSAFTGNATRVKTAEDNRLVAAISIYESDFGELQVIPNRFQRAR